MTRTINGTKMIRKINGTINGTGIRIGNLKKNGMDSKVNPK